MTEHHLNNALFVTGTDTNVGKTHVTCLIARQLIERGLKVAAYKPACSGAIGYPSSPPIDGQYRWDDIERLKTVIGGHWTDETICPQRFLAPVAPPVAAQLEGRQVDFERLVSGAARFPNTDILLIEGAGGWLSPVTETQTVADLARELGAPILIVARSGLGTINHTLLTVESIRSRGLAIAGIVLNSVVADPDDLSVQTNADEIEARSGVPVFGTVAYQSESELRRAGQPVTIRWESLATRSKRQ
ncbi:dethiobiotin synthase [Schlesneria paludicola]|uniref:dethiobiotin synthase n=1 Tax=Schlesneria paludicola TaxID=360056 RepID=UPI00029B2B15|nr:dethiobiotin synthase [Schlesneria paludicola]